MSEDDPLLRLEVKGRSLELTLPLVEQVHSLVMDEIARNPEALGGSFPLILLHFVAKVDGAAMDLDKADALATDADVVRVVLGRVRVLLESRREKGRIYLLCPGCHNWEIEVPVDAYALAIAAPIPSVFDGPYLRIPSLAGTLEPGERPAGMLRAAMVSVALPSALAGTPGPVRRGTLVAVRGEPDDYVEVPEDADDEFEFSHCGPGWRALLRLSRALQPSHDTSVLEQMPAVDFFFLDLAYYLTRLAPIRADTPGRLRCPRCATEFLPVA
jgi:hypothetical protein